MSQSFKKLSNVLLVLLFIIFCFGLESCRSSKSYRPSYRVKDNKNNVWNQKNRRINKFVRQYSRSQHVKQVLKRAKPYLPYIKQQLRKRRLPMELAYLPMLESSFNPKAKSPTGARGMWQFTKGTAKDYGLKIGWFRDDRLDWRKSTRAAVRYLDVLGKKFNYNWELALAAYNGGPGYIQRTVRRQRSWNYWKLRLRREPREYVPRFLAMLHVARKKYSRLYLVLETSNVVENPLHAKLEESTHMSREILKIPHNPGYTEIDI
ncbi:MAG: lytic transglycosylase domain-containing protein [SAR324 cluster bacterium]|nr:lytic transglycosylase domain-containing protein [SAR324 cluster bacterium]